MPIPIPILAAGIAGVGNIADGLLQGGQNKKNREHQEYMYDKNNAYNTPQQQMQRFKAAGLNPHLIYGQGNSGNASMPGNPDTEAPKTGIADMAQNYVSNTKTVGEIDNMKTAQEVMEADKILKSAQTQATLSGAAKTDLEKMQMEEMFQYVKNQAELNIQGTQISNQAGQQSIKNLIAQESLTRQQEKGVLVTMQKTRDDMKTALLDRNLKSAQLVYENMKNEMMKNGVNINDPIWARYLAEEFKNFDPAGLLNSVFDSIKENARKSIKAFIPTNPLKVKIDK